MTDQATFMFGIGATKAGTSWLYRYLCAHPDCAMPATKELHYFDTTSEHDLDGTIRDLERQERQIAWNAERKEGLEQALRFMKVEGLKRLRKMLKAPRTDDQAYREFMLSHFEEGAKLTGDITPSYALLPAARLSDMVGMAAETRFIYILRDPVDRLWSHVRMVARRQAEEGQPLHPVATRILENVIHKKMRPAMLARSDYAGILEKLDQAIPRENLKIVFFEDMFREKTIRDICEFLNISYHPAELKKKVHAGQAVALDPELKVAARALLDDQYQAMERRFGDLPNRWKRDFAKVA